MPSRSIAARPHAVKSHNDPKGGACAAYAYQRLCAPPFGSIPLRHPALHCTYSPTPSAPHERQVEPTERMYCHRPLRVEVTDKDIGIHIGGQLGPVSAVD